MGWVVANPSNEIRKLFKSNWPLTPSPKTDHLEEGGRMGVKAGAPSKLLRVVVRAVCFDLGGVLIRINRTWGEAVCAAGVECRSANLERALGVFDGLEAHQSDSITEAEYLERLRNFLELASADEALRVHEGIVRDTFPGALELVQSLKGEGIVTGCLSNTNKLHWSELMSGRFPIMAELQIRLASHEMALNKPDSRVYEQFELAAGVEPWDIVYFDDTPGHVDAARVRGWRGYVVDAAGDPVEQMRAALRTEKLLDELHA